MMLIPVFCPRHKVSADPRIIFEKRNEPEAAHGSGRRLCQLLRSVKKIEIAKKTGVEGEPPVLSTAAPSRHSFRPHRHKKLHG
jgi:hypothetical protein